MLCNEADPCYMLKPGVNGVLLMYKQIQSNIRALKRWVKLGCHLKEEGLREKVSYVNFIKRQQPSMCTYSQKLIGLIAWWLARVTTYKPKVFTSFTDS